MVPCALMEHPHNSLGNTALREVMHSETAQYGEKADCFLLTNLPTFYVLFSKVLKNNISA